MENIAYKRGDALYVKFSHLINMTDHQICFYDTTGAIAHVNPKAHIDRLSRVFSRDDHMVIAYSEAEGLAQDVNPDCLVIPLGPGSKGRDDIVVVKLVRPSDGAIVEYTPAGVNSGKNNDYYII